MCLLILEHGTDAVHSVLNLPIYVPTLAFTLDVSYDMNYELLGEFSALRCVCAKYGHPGQAAGNILAGLVGTIPNILVCSLSWHSLI
jgi:SulP family sulfate permease